MGNRDGDILFVGDDLEITCSMCESGRLGLEVNAAPATHPQEPEVVQALRDLLTHWLVDNGYE